MTVPHIAFVGYSGSGKTTIAAQVVAHLKQKGYRIGVLKHDAHDFQLDWEGKDTYKYAEAQADAVMIASSSKLNYFERFARSYSLEQLLERFQQVDLVIIEGYKQENTTKILVARTEEQLALRHELSGLAAIATTLDPGAVEIDTAVPVLRLNDLDQILTFIENWYQKN